MRSSWFSASLLTVPCSEYNEGDSVPSTVELGIEFGTARKFSPMFGPGLRFTQPHNQQHSGNVTLGGKAASP